MSARRTPDEPPRRRGAAQARSEWGELFDSYRNHHRKTARDSFERLRSAPLSSMMTGLVMAIALALPVALLLVLSSVQTISSGWEDSVRMSAYLSTDVDAARAETLRNDWATISGVASVAFLHRDDALAQFRADSGLDDALDYLEENPLPHTLIVTPSSQHRDPDSIEALMTELTGTTGVDQVQMDMEWLQRLNAIADLLRHAVLALGLVLGVAVILIIGNTIRLAIESRRSEIVVVKLVGGTDAFVRRPFLYTGLWYGLLGGLLAWWLVEIALWWLSRPVDQLASLYGSGFELMRLPFTGILLLLVVSMVLGWLGSWVAVWRHLRRIEPE